MLVEVTHALFLDELLLGLPRYSGGDHYVLPRINRLLSINLEVPLDIQDFQSFLRIVHQLFIFVRLRLLRRLIDIFNYLVYVGFHICLVDLLNSLELLQNFKRAIAFLHKVLLFLLEFGHFLF